MGSASKAEGGAQPFWADIPGFLTYDRFRTILFPLFVGLEKGTRKVWGSDKYFLGEPIHAPRSEDAPEGDGYVIQLGHNHETSLTELLIFDAADIEPGPVCRAHLPVRIPPGFHGTWVGA